jgi:hypothetical protein
LIIWRKFISFGLLIWFVKDVYQMQLLFDVFVDQEL